MTVAKRAAAEVLPPAQMPALRAHAGIAAVIPQTLAEALTLAKLVCDAGLAPDSYSDKAGTPDQQKIAIGILKSLEVGLPPITGLSTIAIINKRPCIWGDGAVALVQSRGVVERIEEAWEGAETMTGPVENDRGEKDTPTIRDFPDAYAAIYRIWRKGQETPYEGRFSVRDARRAHLWGNPKKVPWIEHPKRMLKARARAFALRDGFSDCLHGLSIREEVQDLPAEAPEQADVSFLSDEPAQIAAPTEQPIGEVTPVSPEASAPEPASTTHGERPSAAAGDAGAPAPQDETASAPGEPANGDDDSAFPPPTVLEIEPDADEQAVIAWCKVAAEILSVAPSPKWIDGWLASNASALNRIKTAGPKGVRFYKRLVDRASERAGELRAAA